MFTSPPPNVGSDLVRIHRVITRSLAVSLQHSQPTGPSLELRDGFQLYLGAFVSLLHAHHLGEEEIAFPYWRNKIPQAPFDLLGKHHQQIVPLLDKINGWLATDRSAWEPASIVDLHTTLGMLHGIWRIHFPIEEANFGLQNSLKYLTLEENAQLSGQLAAHGQQHALPSNLVMPFVLYNLSVEDRNVHVQLLPQVISQQLIPITWKADWAPMQPFLLE